MLLLINLLPFRAVLLEPTDEANRYNLGHITPKTLHKALYVVFSKAVNHYR